MSETSNNDKNNTTTTDIQTEQRQHETTTNATNTPTEVAGASSQPSSSATTKSTTIPAETQQAIANIATAIQSTPPVPVNTAPVKLFVGQIPKGLDENGLMPLFRAFGNIVEVKVIRDKMTGESKGCCFVNFERREDAEQCIAKLHNKHTLPPVANPMQVSYADQPVTAAAASSSRTQDVKLFVGQLPKDQPDHVLRPIFEPFGDIEEFKVLRDYSGQSKGCGFVRYNNRDSAIAAIRTLDQQYKIGNLTLQVRFAESSRSNNTSRMPMTYGGYSQTSAYMAQPYGHYGAAAAQPVQYDASGAYSASPYGAHLMSSATGAANPYGGGAGGYGTGAYQPGQVPIPKQTQGPPGANLFIMQIPREWRDESLRAAFAPFGNVLSTRVFIDKMTGASKCFGFVSYDNADSAKNAINTMNGFAVGGRQLQVSLKRENR